MHRFALLGFVALSISACSDDTTTKGSPAVDSGAAVDSGTPATDSGAATVTPLNGCTAYTDKTAGGATITWDLSSTPPSTCLRVKKGGTVTFNGSFTAHPLIPKGGAAPTPFSSTSSGTSATLTFPTVGTFGFVCGIHSTMTGAIHVTE